MNTLRQSQRSETREFKIKNSVCTYSSVSKGDVVQKEVKLADLNKEFIYTRRYGKLPGLITAIVHLMVAIKIGLSITNSNNTWPGVVFFLGVSIYFFCNFFFDGKNGINYLLNRNYLDYYSSLNFLRPKVKKEKEELSQFINQLFSKRDQLFEQQLENIHKLPSYEEKYDLLVHFYRRNIISMEEFEKKALEISEPKIN